ncbi:MAG: hypothetical protein KBA91_02830, partial [Candidatus Moranbacteria bacterium]|nr:hypothetical protein [Candidatus Moranbacteria bacterium]
PYRYGYNILRAIMHRGLLSQGEIGLIRRDTAGMSGSYTGSVANGVTTGTYNGVPECGENFSRLPDPTGDFVLTGCDIAIGQSTCNATLNYWSAGMPTAMVRVFQGLVTGANLISNTASAVLLRTVQHGSGVGNTFSLTYPYSAADGTSKYFILKQQLLTVNCVPGGVWDVPSGKCVVSAGPSAALNICPTGTPSVVVTGTQNLTAWYTPTGTSFVGCSNNPAGAVNHTNRTSNAVWSTSGASAAKATVGNGVNGGVVTGVSATAGIPVIVTANDATNSVSNAININVLDACPPDTCNNHAVQAAGLCVGQSFTIDDLCGNPNTPCGGTRVCDYNWKEVAP